MRYFDIYQQNMQIMSWQLSLQTAITCFKRDRHKFITTLSSFKIYHHMLLIILPLFELKMFKRLNDNLTTLQVIFWHDSGCSCAFGCYCILQGYKRKHLYVNSLDFYTQFVVKPQSHVDHLLQVSLCLNHYL